MCRLIVWIKKQRGRIREGASPPLQHSSLHAVSSNVSTLQLGLLSIYIILKTEKEKNQLVKADNQKHISFLTQTTYTRLEVKESKLETSPK